MIKTVFIALFTSLVTSTLTFWALTHFQLFSSKSVTEASTPAIINSLDAAILDAAEEPAPKTKADAAVPETEQATAHDAAPSTSDSASTTITHAVPTKATEPTPIKEQPKEHTEAAAASSVVVPRVTGHLVAHAKRTLEAQGLKLGKIRYVYDEDRRSGIVVQQKPAANVDVEAGTPVNLVVNNTD